jgi:hypothetical protein
MLKGCNDVAYNNNFYASYYNQLFIERSRAGYIELKSPPGKLYDKIIGTGIHKLIFNERGFKEGGFNISDAL